MVRLKQIFSFINDVILICFYSEYLFGYIFQLYSQYFLGSELSRGYYVKRERNNMQGSDSPGWLISDYIYTFDWYLVCPFAFNKKSPTESVLPLINA